MLSSLRISQIYVLDQDQAVDFYVGKLGLEVNTDQDLGFMRFLTVSVPGDPDHQIPSRSQDLPPWSLPRRTKSVLS